jgi:PIN domain nuclease of toxin-antitoxin system
VLFGSEGARGPLGDALRDPADQAIVATARVGTLRLLTADSGLVQVVA